MAIRIAVVTSRTDVEVITGIARLLSTLCKESAEMALIWALVGRKTHIPINANAPDDAILTRRFAQKIFGKRSPIGEVFTYNNKLVTVRGVIDEPTDKSSFEFDVLLSIHLNDGALKWGTTFKEFVHLSPHFDIHAFHANRNRYKDADALSSPDFFQFLSYLSIHPIQL